MRFCQRRFVKDFLIKFTENLHFRAKNKAGNLFLDSRPTVLFYAVRSAFNFFTSSRGSPAYSAIISSVNIPSSNILLQELAERTAEKLNKLTEEEFAELVFLPAEDME